MVDLPYQPTSWCLILLGVSAGAAVVPLNLIVLAQTEPADVGITSAVLQSALSVGGSLGLAVLLTRFAAGDDTVEGVVNAFWGGAVIAAVAALVGLLVWHLPGGKSPTTTA